MGCQSGFKVNHHQKFNEISTKLNISDSFWSPSYRLQKHHVASGYTTSSPCAKTDESHSVPVSAGNQGPRVTPNLRHQMSSATSRQLPYKELALLCLTLVI